ncbi:MAG TPA: biliverdin-producing heme oxygenase [Pseudolysinimonas sp.]|jgi:heme oxygenase
MSVATLDVAALIRTASADDHRATESRGFITRLLGGELTLDDYTRYLAQYARVYEALESRPDDGPAVFDPRLRRLDRIASDLDAVAGPDWRDRYPALPATTVYASRLRALAAAADERDRTVRYLAHHYARYLGDLSGGQAIAALVARHYGATPRQLSFYDFSELGTVVQAKRDYRERMNALALDADAVDALLTEVRVAFGSNGAIFDQLDA